MSMEIKPLLIRLIQHTYEQEMALIEHLNEEERSASGSLERWSAKDVIAHNAFWKEYRSRSLREASPGEQALSEDEEDALNAQVFEKYSHLSLNGVLAFALSAQEALLETIQLISEERLNDTSLSWQEGRPVWRIFTSYGCSHSIIHLAEHYRQRGESHLATRLWEATAKQLVALDDSPVWQGTVKYNLACQYAQDNQPGKAIDHLKKALQLNPGLSEWSQRDPDLIPLHESTAYKNLYSN
jgi:hypothetical protein